MEGSQMRPLNIGKICSDHYELVFCTSHGRMLCDISVALPGRMLDTRSDADKLMEALKKAKALAHALDTAIEE
jgi:hypothetical protein